MPTCAEAFRAAARALALAGVPDAPLDARLLLLAAAGLDWLDLIREPERALPDDAVVVLDGYVARRAAREPVSRILGRRDFYGLSLDVVPGVLDPRPDTETLVEAVLREVGGRRGEPLRVVDLGTGSGAVLCALLSELPAAVGVAVDRSAQACAAARRNLEAHGLARRSLVVRGDWSTALGRRCFDVAASNPPYVETAVIASLDPDVRDHDPMEALDGGADGLDCYRILAADMPRVLVPGGLAALEVGRGQHADVAQILGAAGFGALDARRDLAGIERVVLGRAPGGT